MVGVEPAVEFALPPFILASVANRVNQRRRARQGQRQGRPP